MITRRRFLANTCGAVVVSPAASVLVSSVPARPPAAPGSASQTSQVPADALMKRIGVTTVCFRDWFPATRTPGEPAPAGGDLTLLTAPKFIADRLGIHNVEVWNQHFASESLDYCREVKAAAAAAGSVITNIQLDGMYNLSSPDAAERTKAIEHVKGWMDRAAAVGAPRMRANAGGRRGDAVPEHTIDAFRQLAAYGKTINVKILVENHNGMSVEIPKVVEIVKRVNDPFCRALSDWGNTPSTSPEARVSGLTEMLPLIDFVSAKQVDFDAQNRHVSYDVVPLMRATETSGYRGVYSIELYGQNPPPDPVAAVRAMMQTLAANIKA